MALRNPISQLTTRASPATISKLTCLPSISSWKQNNAVQSRSFATPVPPVTQDATGSKGPTAMVFMNMGGPSKTDEVGDFLSRLFVSSIPHPSLLHALIYAIRRQMETLSHSVDCSPTLDP